MRQQNNLTRGLTVLENLPPKPPPRVLGPITRTDVVIYQGASGDFEPMHHDEPFAQAAGMKAPIVVGMLPAGALCAWATDWLGPRNVREIEVRWREPVWPGDTVQIDGTPAEVSAEDGDRMIEVNLSGTNQHGRVVVQGRARFVVAEG